MMRKNVLSRDEISDLLEDDDGERARELTDRKLEVLMEFPLELSVRIGTAEKTIDELSKLSTGMVIDLNRMIDEPVALMVNGKHVAEGEVITMGEYFGVRLTSIAKVADRIDHLR